MFQNFATMKSVGVYYNPLIFTDKSKLFKRLEHLIKYGLNVVLLNEQRDESFSNIPSIQYVQNFLHKDIQAVIVFGGDGTMLILAKKVLMEEIPILGFNHGKLGFLSECNKNEFDKIINDLIHEKYSIEKRNVLACSINSKKYYAINDVVIAKGDYPRLIEIELFKDKDYLYKLRGDGVIISTPLGSTAYSLSAGGSILHPDCNVFIITPINPHNQFSKPVVFSSDSTFEIKLNCEIESRLSIDGENICKVKNTEKILIKQSETSSQFIKFKDKNFLRILRKKFVLE